MPTNLYQNDADFEWELKFESAVLLGPVLISTQNCYLNYWKPSASNHFSLEVF